jgi:hypothetical protein
MMTKTEVVERIKLMKLNVVLETHIVSLKERAKTEPYTARHIQALQNPIGYERALVMMINGWVEWSICYANEHGINQLGTDYILGYAWLSQARHIADLLNGEHGRLDAGLTDTLIKGYCRMHGFGEPALIAHGVE